MLTDSAKVKGLSSEQVLLARQTHGENKLSYKKENGILQLLIGIFKEPMVILLLIAISIYFVSGDFADGIFLALAVILISAISFFQDSRSKNALEKLKSFSQPQCTVIRDGEVISVKTEELVVGDYIRVEEGTTVPADATIVQSNDFSVNEAMLTGESLSVFKDSETKDNLIFSGTNVATGLAIAI
ncbi:MAG: HAD-IC family P-type ATPase, partial [Bacteroidia bacterium]